MIMKSALLRLTLCFTASILLISLPMRSYAWGGKGHRIVALIAVEYLSPKARKEVKNLLGTQSLASIADDADQIRSSRPETGPWHFVDIPKDETNYEKTRDCAETHDNETQGGDCVIEAIKHFKPILKDASQSKENRAEALIYLVHFIGDMHQPLHCADNNDRGGNGVKVTFFGKRTSLHSVWDTGIIEEADLTDSEFADALMAELTPQKKADFEKGTEEDWALEAHKLAKTKAYKTPPNKRLGAGYYNANFAVVDEQLTKAGIRLAKALNDLLG